MMNKTIMLVACMAAASAMAQSRENFLLQQTQQEMQRVGSQVDALQNNLDDLQRRVHKLEGGGDTASLRNEIEALKATVAQLRRELASQRGEIVRDLTGRIKTIQAASTPTPKPKPVVVSSTHREYVVQSGDTLSMISSTFGVSMTKIREMNHLKGNSLRVGQKIILPEK